MLKLACGLALVLFLAGCASRHSSIDARVYRMGERVQVGPLIYTVLDTEWLDQMDTPAPRMPRSRFLIVRLSVTNSGVTTSGIPPISVADRGGTSYPELTDAEGLSEWLGYIRTVKPADTLHGRVAFDVPTAEYQLHLTDDAEPENVKLAMVDLPLQLGAPRVPNPPVAGQ
jgi:hypothetical protein